MKDVYKIDVSNLNSIKERIMKEHNSFSDKIKNNLSSGYLNNCSDASVTSMKNKINEYCSIIEKGYSSIESWLEDYINDASNIEQGITSGKYNIKDKEVSRIMASLLENKEVEIEASPDIENLLKRSSIKQNYPLYINGNYNPADNYETLPFITGPNEKQNKVELYGATKMVYRPGIDKNEIDDMVYRKGKEHATLELYSDEMEKPEYDERGFEINKTEEIDLEAIKEENQALLDSIEPIRIDLESQIAELDKVIETLSELKKKHISSKDDTPYNPNDPEYQKIVKRQTEILEKRRELAESLSTILMFEQQVQNNLDLIPYMEIEMSDDYKKFVSEYEVSKEYIGPDALKTGVNRWDYLADYEKNGDGGYVFKLREGEFETEIKVEDFSKYATEAEKNMYHYLCQTQSMEKANEYLLKKVDQINMMKGAELANYDLSDIKTTIEEEENADSAIEAAWAGLKNSFQAWGMGLLDGTENFVTGFAKWFSKDKHMSAEQYSKIIVAQYLTEHKYGTHYEVGTVTGNLLPAIAVSLVSRSAALGMALPAEVAATYGEFAGVVSMGLSAGGNAKEYAMQHLGATESSALLYGLLIGTSEAVLGRFLGKIPGLSAEAGLSIKNLLMEGLEEWSQDWIAAGLQAVMYGKEINFDELNEESMKSFLMGVLMAGAMNGASAVVQMKIDGQDIEINTNDIIGYLKENIAGNNNNSAVHNNRGSINLNAFKELFKSKGKVKATENDYQVEGLNSKENEVVNGWDLKVDKQVGNSIHQIISDDGYVYGVHITPYENWANGIFNEGLILTGNKLSGAAGETIIDLEDNVVMRPGKKSKAFEEAHILNNLSGASSYKTGSEKRGYGMIIKIPKEYTIFDENGNVIGYNYDKITYEKNGQILLKPEFVAAKVEVENGRVLDSPNNRFKEYKVNDLRNYSYEEIAKIYDTNPNYLANYLLELGYDSTEIENMFNSLSKNELINKIKSIDPTKYHISSKYNNLDKDHTITVDEEMNNILKEDVNEHYKIMNDKLDKETGKKLQKIYDSAGEDSVVIISRVSNDQSVEDILSTGLEVSESDHTNHFNDYGSFPTYLYEISNAHSYKESDRVVIVVVPKSDINASKVNSDTSEMYYKDKTGKMYLRPEYINAVAKVDSDNNIINVSENNNDNYEILYDSNTQFFYDNTVLREKLFDLYDKNPKKLFEIMRKFGCSETEIQGSYKSLSREAFVEKAWSLVFSNSQSSNNKSY